eukprot:4899951-Amphidinium_carterae.1
MSRVLPRCQNVLIVLIVVTSVRSDCAYCRANRGQVRKETKGRPSHRQIFNLIHHQQPTRTGRQ